MFYLTIHSTHFIYGYLALDIVKNHSDSERGNLVSPHRLLFLIKKERERQRDRATKTEIEREKEKKKKERKRDRQK